jgi:hypothetical protein
MRRTNGIVPFVLALLALGAPHCASSTVIHSNPEGADLYIDAVHVGTTPYAMTDTKIAYSVTQITLRKKGYRNLNAQITRDEKIHPPAVAGVCLIVPFFWHMKYHPTHTFELEPEGR